MMTIAEAIGFNERLGPYVGMEFEYENAPSSMFDNGRANGWWLTMDGSLRNSGVELRSDPVIDHKGALIQLEELLFAYPSLNPTRRCAFHVHVNVSDMNAKQFWVMLTLSYLLEPYLFHISGERESNIYCVPFRESMDQRNMYRSICEIASEDATGDLRYVLSSDLKYSGINYQRLADIGTLEYRMASGTRDVRKAARFVDILLDIRSASFKTDFGELWDELIIMDMTALDRRIEEIICIAPNSTRYGESMRKMKYIISNIVGGIDIQTTNWLRTIPRHDDTATPVEGEVH